MTDYQFDRFVARDAGSRGAKKCPRCNKGFVTRYGLFCHPDNFLCYKCWLKEKAQH